MKGDSKMRKRYCSMCGRLMDEHIDENTGKPFDIQLCSGVCIGAAWRNVTKSIKNGVQPQWTAAVLRRKSKAFEYHNQIVNLLNKKFTQKKNCRGIRNISRHSLFIVETIRKGVYLK